MNFIKHADFILKPYELYMHNLVYIWRSDSSTPSPDSIIRLPFRWQFIGSNWLLGPQLTAYFYILFVLGFSFIAMYLFLKRFVPHLQQSTYLLASALFAINPIYLGNISKIGLQFGVACLPLMLVCAKKYTNTQKFVWIIPLLILLLASFVHPFTLVVNCITIAIYLLFNIKRIKASHFAIGVALMIGLSAYIIMPLYSLGSVSRSQFETATDQATVFTGIVDIANTDSVLEGAVLAKSVLADYTFYNNAYYPVYLLSVMTILTIVLYGAMAMPQKDSSRKLLFGSVSAFVALVFLADVGTGIVRSILLFVIQTPIGWAFRSPLKWQLYIPFVLFIALAIAMKVYSKQTRKTVLVASCVAFVGMNAYLAVDIYSNLLRPKNIDMFSTLAAEDLPGKRALFLRDFACGQYLSQNSGLNSELDYLLQTSGLQTTYAGRSDITRLDVHDYDYVIDCTNYVFADASDWQLITAIDDSPLKLFRTNEPDQAAITTTNSAWYGSAFDVTTLQNIVTRTDEAEVAIIQEPDAANGEIYEILNGVKKANFSKGFINTNVVIDKAYNAIRLLSGSDVDDERILVNQNLIELVGDEVTTAGDKAESRIIPSDNEYSVSYSGAGFDFKNLIDNSSFETGLWQEKVGDCYNYDHRPILSMAQTDTGVDGDHALSLSALTHLACTSTDTNAALNPGGHIFTSFKANMTQGERMQYTIKFNDQSRSTFERVITPTTTNEWHEYTNFISVPETATGMTLFIYAIPEIQGVAGSTVLYDDFFVTNVPDIANKLYIVGSDSKRQDNLITSAQKITPVQYTATLANPKGHTSTYVVLKERYNKGWRITSMNGEPNSNRLVTAHSYDSNGYNVWRIDGLETLGTDVQFLIEFAPQKSFYIGAIISAATLLGTVTYLGYVWRFKR